MIPIMLANLMSLALEARPPWRAAASGRQKRINLALQGGGANGAFTWGVLDQLLEDGRLDIDGISGASAGAVTPSCWLTASPVAERTRRANGSPISGVRSAWTAICPRCSGAWSS